MSEVPVIDRMPYNSIRIALPSTWNEDPTAPEICYYYYSGTGGPPTLHVRRDDFVMQGAEDGDMEVGDLASGNDLTPPTTKMFKGFAELVDKINQPDITHVEVEPRDGNSQIIRYLRHGTIDDKPGVAFWWIRGVMQGDSFTVVTFDYELYTDQAEQDSHQNVLKRLDLSIREAEVLSLAQAEAMAGTGD